MQYQEVIYTNVYGAKYTQCCCDEFSRRPVLKKEIHMLIIKKLKDFFNGTVSGKNLIMTIYFSL